jgi:hypothetical protein
MKFENIEKIYARLEEISVKIEPKSIPNPSYISEKIGQCHICIEEVEKFFIQVSRELSVYQRAMNNAEAAYIMARDELLSTDAEIISLPSSKDREARANNRLKSQLFQIRDYKSQLSDLERVFNAINVKLKNLDRQNRDIKVQLRLMESQIKLGSGNINDPVTKNLMDELKNTAMGKDMWEEAETKMEETKTMDPTKPIDIDSLDPFDYLDMVSNMGGSNSDSIPSNNLSTSGINSLSIPAETPEGAGIETLEVSKPNGQDPTIVNLDVSLTESTSGEIPVPPEVQTPEPIKSVDEIEQPEDYFNQYVREFEETFPEDDLLATIEPSKEIEPGVSSTHIDLDKILVPSTVIGGEQKTNESKLSESNQKVIPQEKPKDPNEIDFSALLSQFN